MSFPLKLELVFNGYTPTHVGLLASVLGTRFKITEEQLRKVLPESLLIKGGNLKQAQRWQIERAIEMLHAISNDKPDYETALSTVMAVLTEINFPGTTRAYADRLAKYLVHNWDTLSLRAPLEPTGDESEEGATRQRLSGVGSLSMPRVGSVEPTKEVASISDLWPPQSGRSTPAQPARGFQQNRAKSPVLGRP